MEEKTQFLKWNVTPSQPGSFEGVSTRVQYITQFHLVDAEEERLSLDIWQERYSSFRTSSTPIASRTHTHIGDDEIMPSGIGLQIFLRGHYRHYHESTSCTTIILALKRFRAALNGSCHIGTCGLLEN